jgi:hypothetical protein
MLPSASKLERATKCLGSVILPRVDELTPAAERGRAIHGFLARVTQVGREVALEELPDDQRALCAAIDLDVIPTSALDVIAEIAMAFDAESGVARELGRNIGRAYPPLAAREFGGTADIVTLTHDEVFVADFKTGHGVLAPARENMQLRMLGLAASRLFKRRQLRVALIRIAEDGTPFFDSADMDAVELDIIAAELHDLANRILRARDLLSMGEPPSLTTGTHCRRCPSLVYCPAQTVLIRRLAQEPDAVAAEILDALTPRTAARGWARLKIAEEFVRRTREALYAYARENPIDLGSGIVLGEVETARRAIAGTTAHGVLTNLHGREVADAASELEMSQASIDRALRVVAERTGAKLSMLKRDVLAALEQAGAITVRVSRSVREHRSTNTPATPE